MCDNLMPLEFHLLVGVSVWMVVHGWALSCNSATPFVGILLRWLFSTGSRVYHCNGVQCCHSVILCWLISGCCWWISILSPMTLCPESAQLISAPDTPQAKKISYNVALFWCRWKVEHSY
jgi:hypothetical protein